MVKDIVRKITFKTGLWRLAKYLNRNRSIILMYHGLTEDESCDDWTQIQLCEFKKQMSYVRENYNVVSISDMLEMFQDQNTTAYMAAITFDDGYRSVCELALPVLKELVLPATIYITSNFISNDRKDNRYIWSDYVKVLLKSSELSTIDLSHFGLDHYVISDPVALRIAANKICDQLKLITFNERNKIISYLEDNCLEAVDHDRFSVYDPMTWEEVKYLSSYKLISIGGHTRNHPILSKIGRNELEGEILGCKEDIENNLEFKITDFAYPNGRLIDFNEEAIGIVRKGYRCAVTTVNGFNNLNQDLYLLKRIGIGRNSNIEDFKLLLSNPI